MAKFTDSNGAIWEVTPAAANWVASPADESDTGYINTFADIQGDRDIAGQRFNLQWPFQKEPTLIGKHSESTPEKAINAFAQQNRAKATVRVSAQAPKADASGNSPLLGLLLVAAVLYFADNKRR